jgi:branched-chain amino acid transport system permease protein
MNAGYWLQQVLNGLSLACLYATLATAYALMQGITNRIVLSFGDFASFGAFMAVYAAIWSLLQGYDAFLPIFFALISGMAVAAAVGRFAESQVFGPLAQAPSQAIMIASIGVSIVIQEVLRLQSNARDQWIPPLFDGGLTVAGGAFPVTIGQSQVAVMAASCAALLSVFFVMRHTAAGRLWRAVSQNPRLAQLIGIDTATVFRWSFMAAGALAGLAGGMVAVSYGGVGFIMGLVLGFKAMFAAIIGGFGKISGAVAGGVFLAFVETAWVSIFPGDYRDVAVFGIIIFILVIKPEGLLGGIEQRESEI